MPRPAQGNFARVADTAFSSSGVSVDTAPDQLGIFFGQFFEHGQFNNAVAASQRPEVDDEWLTLPRGNDLLVAARTNGLIPAQPAPERIAVRPSITPSERQATSSWETQLSHG